MKLNDADGYPEMFLREAEGLQMIRKNSAIGVPEFIGSGRDGADAFLLLEWINPGRNTATSQELLGKQLAALHKCGNENFGLDQDNYIGSLRQSNRQHKDWTSFFICERLEPQVRLAYEKGLADKRLVNDFEKLYIRLPELYEPETASLVHGDLWSGNYLIATDGKPYLLDPAVYYGHREMDIAMSTLFGGFSETFYQYYNEAFPLHPGWKNRLDLWNLYPLLVHVNLFGRSYLGQVKGNLKRYL